MNALEKLEQLKEKKDDLFEEEVDMPSLEDLQYVIEKGMSAMWFLFLCFTIGVVSYYLTEAEWVLHLVNVCIVVCFGGIWFLKHKTEKKKKERDRGTA